MGACHSHGKDKREDDMGVREKSRGCGDASASPLPLPYADVHACISSELAPGDTSARHEKQAPAGRGISSWINSTGHNLAQSNAEAMPGVASKSFSVKRPVPLTIAKADDTEERPCAPVGDCRVRAWISFSAEPDKAGLKQLAARNKARLAAFREAQQQGAKVPCSLALAALTEKATADEDPRTDTVERPRSTGGGPCTKPADQAIDTLMGQLSLFREQMTRAQVCQTPVPRGLASPVNPHRAFSPADLQNTPRSAPALDFLEDVYASRAKNREKSPGRFVAHTGGPILLPIKASKSTTALDALCSSEPLLENESQDGYEQEPTSGGRRESYSTAAAFVSPRGSTSTYFSASQYEPPTPTCDVLPASVPVSSPPRPALYPLPALACVKDPLSPKSFAANLFTPHTPDVSSVVLVSPSVKPTPRRLRRLELSNSTLSPKQEDVFRASLASTLTSASTDSTLLSSTDSTVRSPLRASQSLPSSLSIERSFSPPFIHASQQTKQAMHSLALAPSASTPDIIFPLPLSSKPSNGAFASLSRLRAHDTESRNQQEREEDKTWLPGMCLPSSPMLPQSTLARDPPQCLPHDGILPTSEKYRTFRSTLPSHSPLSALSGPPVNDPATFVL